jgi:thioredoxin-dependent peroxiredoxin
VKVGDKAPAFTLQSQTGAQVSLADLLGKSCVILYFYPKDNTYGCIAESCAFRDQYEVFKDAGADVVGISSDSPESHKQFAAQYRLPFLLLSDLDSHVRRLYGVPNTMGIIPGRVTFVIDKEGVVRYVFNSQFNPSSHVEQALKIIKDCEHGCR